MAEIKKNVNELREDMVVSKDIISEEGIFLIPAQTKLNKNHILKIQLYQISTVYILDEPEVVVPVKKPVNSIPKVHQTVEFKTFVSKYIDQVNNLEKEFSKMVTSGQIDHSGLSNYVQEMVDSGTKSNLFTYLCRIQVEDQDTFAHSLNVSILANIFAKWLKFDEDEQIELSIAGLLHDIGKTKLDPVILNKKGVLSPEEFNHLKTHTTLGYKILENSSASIGIKQTVLLHHEKLNGTGYPLNPAWDTIHSYAKIIAIVDMYDEITSERPYRKKQHPFNAIRILEEKCFGVLDTDYLYVFLENIAHN
ncbi:MAG: HD domain-containing protein, partial [Vallitaleaceae bacterium]|nr:HD domain-containing protein [Vallitaleaceae bacterium]